MKTFVASLILAAALLVAGCSKPDPTVALEAAVMAQHDSIMALDGYLTQLAGALTKQAEAVDTNLKKQEEKDAAFAKMAVFQKEAKAVTDAQAAMQEWMAAFGNKPAADKPVEERVTWYEEQQAGITKVAELYGNVITAATQTLKDAGAEVPAMPEAQPKQAEGGEGEGHDKGHE